MSVTTESFSLCEIIIEDLDKTFLLAMDNKRELIDKCWMKSCQENSFLTNGKILKYNRFKKESGVLFLYCSLVDYKYFYVKQQNIDLGIVPLGVSGITYYIDKAEKKILIGKRSTSVTQYPGFFELAPSGAVEANCLDIEAQLLIELEEELGIKNNMVESVKGLFLVEDHIESNIDVCFEIKLNTKPQINLSSGEYSSINHINENGMTDFFDENNVVDTSISLFKLWSNN